MDNLAVAVVGCRGIRIGLEICVKTDFGIFLEIDMLLSFGNRPYIPLCQVIMMVVSHGFEAIQPRRFVIITKKSHHAIRRVYRENRSYESIMRIIHFIF